MAGDSSTQGDPADEDIDNSPSLYHNYGGAAVRIQCYWTTPVVQNSDYLMQTVRKLRTADRLLRKYTLSLDAQPAIDWDKCPRPTLTIPLPQGNWRLPFPFNGIGIKLPGDVTIVAPPVCTSKDIPAEAILNYEKKIWVPGHRARLAELSAFSDLRDLIEKVKKEENRLIVVFTLLSSDDATCGYTVGQESEWLPWVVCDPTHFHAEDACLLHEMGHACGLGHQQMEDYPAKTDLKDSDETHAHNRNVMSHGEVNRIDQFWPWQVDAFYNSYWCKGPRPTDWWVPRCNAVECAYIWNV